MPPPPWAGNDPLDELVRQADAATERARREVARSHALVGGTLIVRDHLLGRRCAWCGRLELDGMWLESEDVPAFVRAEIGRDPERVTHTICPDCFARQPAPEAT